MRDQKDLTEMLIVKKKLSWKPPVTFRIFVNFCAGDFALWSGNQPNNIGGVQHCGVVDRENKYRMADEACDGYNAYVCDIRKCTSLFIKIVTI